MRGWRVLAIVPLTVALFVAGLGLVAFMAVAIPSSVAFHLLNQGGR